MLARQIEREAAERQRARRVADALGVEAGDLLLEAAGPEQQVARLDAAIVEIERPPGLAVHELGRLAELEAGRVALDQHRADAADSRPEPNVDEKNVGLAA